MEPPRHVAATELVIAARRRLDRRPAVALHVPRKAHTWIDVLPFRNAAQGIDVTRGCEGTLREIGGGIAHVDVVEPQAEIQRDAPDRPRILREDAELDRLPFLLEVRLRVVLDARRSAAREVVAQRVAR